MDLISYECSIDDMIDFDTNYTPTQIESIDYFINKERHNNDYYVINELEKLYLNDKFFGNYDNLIFNGLPMHYNLLKKYVFENNLIGMILYGADIKNQLDIVINTIFLLDNDDDGIDSVFNLTIKSISNTLINDYIMKEHNLDMLCYMANINNKNNDITDICFSIKNL